MSRLQEFLIYRLYLPTPSSAYTVHGKKIIKACFLQYRTYTFLEILKGSKAGPPAVPHACQFFPVAAGESAAFSGTSPSRSGRRREGRPSSQGKGSLNPQLPLEPPLGLQDSLN